VKERENCKPITECLQKHGIPMVQEVHPPVPPPIQLPARTSLKPRLIQAPRTSAMDSIYSTHAKEGFVYWLRDDVKKGGKCGKPR